MPNPESQSPGPTKGANVGYEKRDVDVKWIFGLVTFLLLAVLVTHFVLGKVMKQMKKIPTSTDPWSSGRAPAAASEQPPLPRLQISPASDLKAFRLREDSELNSYGWVNQTAGIVRVPIDRAMEMVLQRRLPARTDSNSDLLGPSNYDLQQKRSEDAR
jgi:hypothetical protein